MSFSVLGDANPFPKKEPELVPNKDFPPKLKPLLSLVTEADPNMLVFGINDASLLFPFFASSTWLDLISVVGNPFMEFFEAASAKGLVVGLLQKIP